ncbi:uncharacterized protein B4U79_11743, partial [Dinothrombium tinctorium]
MASMTVMDKFDEANEDWSSYCERMEQYFVVNKITEEKMKLAALITAMGPGPYQLLKDLLYPVSPSSKSFDELNKILKDHLCPKRLVISERFRFFKRSQHEGESVSAFAVELKKLSTRCEFGSNLNDQLRDRLVCGLRSEAMQKKLLTEEKLTFEKALAIAVGMETAEKDTRDIQQKLESVNKVANVVKTKSSTSKRTKTADKQIETCYRCGKGNHKATDCRFREAVCHFCKKKGHIKSACRNRKEKGMKVNQFDEIKQMGTESGSYHKPYM